MLDLSARDHDRVLLAAESVRDVGLADGHPSAHGEAAVKAMGDRAAAGVRQEGLHLDDLSLHPCRFGLRPASMKF